MPNGDCWEDLHELERICLKAKEYLKLIVYQIDTPGVVIDLSEISRWSREILKDMDENVYLKYNNVE